MAFSTGTMSHTAHCSATLPWRKKEEVVLGSSWEEMGSTPGGNNCVPWLFQALSAPLGTSAPRAAWSPSSVPQECIRMNLDRLSARHAQLESKELLLGPSAFFIWVTSDFSCPPTSTEARGAQRHSRK